MDSILARHVLKEVSILLTDVGLAPATKTEQMKIEEILFESDIDSSGLFDFEEFTALHERLVLDFDFMEQQDMIRMAKAIGFQDEEHIFQLKEIFDIIDGDHSGELDISELRQVLGTLYRCKTQILTSEVLWNLFYALGLDPFQDGITFSLFLKMIKNIEDGVEHFDHFRGIFGMDNSSRSGGGDDEEKTSEDENHG